MKGHSLQEISVEIVVIMGVGFSSDSDIKTEDRSKEE